MILWFPVPTDKYPEELLYLRLCSPVPVYNFSQCVCTKSEVLFDLEVVECGQLRIPWILFKIYSVCVCVWEKRVREIETEREKKSSLAYIRFSNDTLPPSQIQESLN